MVNIERNNMSEVMYIVHCFYFQPTSTEKLNSSCRICLNDKTEINSSSNVYLTKGTIYEEPYLKCTGIEFCADFAITTWICDDCAKTLLEFNHFREKCLDSVAYLKNSCENETTEPIEIIELDRDPLVDEIEKVEDIKRIDTKTKIGLICEICGKDFKKSVKRFGSHMRTHNPLDPMPYKCTQCDERFAAKKIVRAHIILEHENPKLVERRKKKIVTNNTQLTNSSVYGLTQKCRICLNKLVLYANLKHQPHHDVFIHCTGIDVNECPPEIPSCICYFCEKTLLIFYNFQKTCWESDIFLRVNANIKTDED